MFHLKLFCYTNQYLTFDSKHCIFFENNLFIRLTRALKRDYIYTSIYV